MPFPTRDSSPAKKNPFPLFKFGRSELIRYGIAILAVLAAAILTPLIRPVLGGKAPLFLFTVSVLLSAMNGMGPGLLATALSLSSVWLFGTIFEEVRFHSSLGVFALVAAGISVVLGRLHRANGALTRSQVALEAANEQLSERSQALSRANEELLRFAYALAHDLNTPVRSICALTDLLVQRNEAKFDETSKECAGLIVNKALRMQAMIKSLLDYGSAIESPPEIVPVDTRAVVQKALKDLDSVIAERRAEISLGPLPVISGPDGQLIQVFSNLISNGIKYCPSTRKPQIRISAEEHARNFVFSVKDNGIGVDMQYSETVFGIFKRLHGDEYEGSGIGLALCRAVIERHGGRIWLESQVGQGTTIYFTLPKILARAA